MSTPDLLDEEGAINALRKHFTMGLIAIVLVVVVFFTFGKQIRSAFDIQDAAAELPNGSRKARWGCTW